MAKAKTMMSALPNPGPPLIPPAGGGKGGRRDKLILPQLLAMTAANRSTLHSWSWYSCKNSLLSLASLTGRRDKALPCFTDTSCEVSCLINRTIPVMFHSCTFGPLISAWPLVQLRLFLWLLIIGSCSFPSTLITSKGPEKVLQGIKWNTQILGV